MLQDKETKNKNHDGHYDRRIYISGFSVILAVAGIIALLFIRPELASKSMITLFIIEIIAAGITRFIFFTGKKHQNRTAILLAAIAGFIIAMFTILFFMISLLPVFKIYPTP